jgi:predicted Zn-dependent protease
MNMKRTRKLALALLLAAATVAAPFAARAQTIIRDTEIEEYMAEWFKPVFTAAGMSPDQVKIILVQDDQVNAFVAGGSNIFFYTGLLQKTENPGEVIGVMAHELGHIQGGHLIRGREAMEKASYESILGMIIGVGAAIATGDGGAAATIGAGSASMAQRGFLKYSRTFEASADQAALKFMNKAQIDPIGLKTFLQKLEGQEFRPETQQSEYVRSHPLTHQRVETVEAQATQSPYKGKPWPEEWNRQHKMMLAKLTGFISPQQVAWNYDDRDNSRESLTARAIAAYRTSDVARALKLANQLLAMEPQNPYFLELKGQMLVDFGRVAEAVPYYEKSVALKPQAGLIRAALAHAQLETAKGNRAQVEKAIDNLNLAAKSEPRSPRIHRLLATAYGQIGEESMAKLHLAEEALLQNKKNYAKTQAEQAQKGLKQGSPGWIRASDILSYIETRRDEKEDEDKKPF